MNIALLNVNGKHCFRGKAQNLAMHIGILIKRLMRERNITTKAMAAYCGVTPGAVSNWFGTGRITKDNLAQVAAVLKVTTDDLISGTVDSGPKAVELDNNPEFPAVRRVALKANAGVSGYSVEYLDDDGPPIVFRANWYKAKGLDPKKLFAVRVVGHSMRPKYSDGDVIVVNTENIVPKDGLIYLVSYEGEFTLKRMVRDAGEWWLSSDNPDQRRYPRKACNSDTDVIGKVIYHQTDNTDD